MAAAPEADSKIILAGAAGLVGQNLIIRLKDAGYTRLVALDRHPTNVALLERLHPDVEVVEADLAKTGGWEEALEGGDVVVMLQANIGAIRSERFVADNVTSTENVLEAMTRHRVGYVLHLSSSVVCSVARDDYTETKRLQEDLVVASGIDYCILRPTLMFGWFDRKHLGWLSRFMRRTPVFPVPGWGRIVRQPLYVGDLCGIIMSCISGDRHVGEIFNISGREKLEYVDIIRAIREEQGLRTLIVPIPYRIFWLMLKTYGLFDREPPFNTDQLAALVAGDEFELIPWWEIFGVPSTPFREALRQTLCDPRFSQHVLDF